MQRAGAVQAVDDRVASGAVMAIVVVENGRERGRVGRVSGLHLRGASPTQMAMGRPSVLVSEVEELDKQDIGLKFAHFLRQYFDDISLIFDDI